MGLFSGLKKVAGNLIGGGLSFLGGERANSAAAANAQDERDFQLMMSNTSHQRAVADLKAAGLNPILAARYGGASTGHAGIAQVVNTLDQAANVGVQSSAQSILRQQTQSNIALQRSQELANTAQAAKTAAETNLVKLMSRKAIEDVTTAKSTAAGEAAKEGYRKSWFNRYIGAPVGEILDQFNPLKGLFK